jgi:hypothetical protein
MRAPATRFEDLIYELSRLLEEVSKLLEAYSQAILNSDY